MRCRMPLKDILFRALCTHRTPSMMEFPGAYRIQMLKFTLYIAILAGIFVQAAAHPLLYCRPVTCMSILATSRCAARSRSLSQMIDGHTGSQASLAAGYVDRQVVPDG